MTPKELGQRLSKVGSDEQLSEELLIFLRSCPRFEWIRFDEIAQKEENQRMVKQRIALLALSNLPRAFQREVSFNKDCFDNSDAFKVIDFIPYQKQVNNA